VRLASNEKGRLADEHWLALAATGPWEGAVLAQGLHATPYGDPSWLPPVDGLFGGYCLREVVYYSFTFYYCCYFSYIE
jgi:hypothetical protein